VLWSERKDGPPRIGAEDFCVQVARVRWRGKSAASPRPDDLPSPRSRGRGDMHRGANIAEGPGPTVHFEL